MRVEVSPGSARLSAGPSTYDGQTATTSMPSRVAGRERHPLALVLAVRVDQPRARLRDRDCARSPARSPGAGPIEATLEVSTTRRTPRFGRSLDRDPRRDRVHAPDLPRRGCEATIPAAWNRTSQPDERTPHRAPVEHVGVHDLDVDARPAPPAGAGRAPSPAPRRPEPTRAAATWAPRKPVAPVTQTFIPYSLPDERRGGDDFYGMPPVRLTDTSSLWPRLRESGGLYHRPNSRIVLLTGYFGLSGGLRGRPRLSGCTRPPHPRPRTCPASWSSSIAREPMRAARAEARRAAARAAGGPRRTREPSA